MIRFLLRHFLTMLIVPIPILLISWVPFALFTGWVLYVALVPWSVVVFVALLAYVEVIEHGLQPVQPRR